MVFGIDDALLGGILSGLGGLAGGLFGSSGDQLKKVRTMSKPQESVFNQYLQQLQGLQGQGGGAQSALQRLQQYMDPSSDIYKQFEEPYLQQFEQETLPQIAERFAGAGALSSSGFGQALGGAAAGLKGQLAAIRNQTAMDSLKNLLQQYNQMSQTAFGQSPFAYLNQQGTGASSGIDFSGLGNLFANMSGKSPGMGTSTSLLRQAQGIRG